MLYFYFLIAIYQYILYFISNDNISRVLYTEVHSMDILSRKIEYDSLEVVIKRNVVNSSIVLYCTDSGYINLFLNAYSASNLQNVNNVVVTCFDKPCYRELKKHNISVAIVSAESDLLVDTTTASSWGTKAFRDKVQWKLNMLVNALQLNIRILYVDSDIILFHNPFPYLNSLIGYDIIAQNDTTLCSGFLYLYPTQETIRTIKKAAAIRPTLKNAGDQLAIVTAVKKNPKVRVFLLPKDLFTNGDIFFTSHNYYWEPTKKPHIMIHNNWIIGTNNKLYRFKETKLYKLDVNAEYSNPNAKYLTIEKWSNTNSNCDM